MKPVKYLRRDYRIINVETGGVEQFKTLNQAKHKSHQLQMKLDKGLGLGSVRRHE